MAKNTAQNSKPRPREPKTKPKPPAGLKISRAQLSRLQTDPENAREHPAENLASIRRSLERFGQVEPLVVWSGYVIGGNGRLEVMRDLGWKSCDVVRVDHLTEAEARGLSVALNRSGDLATWNESKLADLLAQIKADGTDVGDVGFDAAEVDAIIANATAGIDLPGEPETTPVAFDAETGETDDDDDPERWGVLVAAESADHQTELVKMFEVEGLDARPFTKRKRGE